MTTRRPLVLVSGSPQELPSADTLPVGIGSSVWIGTSAPADTTAYPLSWDAESGALFLWFADGTSSQWVEAANSAGIMASLALYGALAGANTWTGAQTFDGGLIVTGPVQETPVVANTGTAYTVDLAEGTVFDLTMTGTPVVFTFPTATAGKQFTLLLTQDGTGTRLATWPASTRWGDTAPTLTTTAGRTDIVSFIAARSYWVGALGGKNWTLSG